MFANNSNLIFTVDCTTSVFIKTEEPESLKQTFHEEQIIENELFLDLRQDEMWRTDEFDNVSNPFVTRSHLINVENVFQNWFTAPWEIIPPNITEYLLRNEKLPNSKYTSFVQLLVEHVRKTDRFTNKRGFESIARSLVKKYPNTFKDIDEDGNVIAEGHVSLMMKLINRNSYLNRPTKKKPD